jgi:hypothetical protein
VRGCGPTAGRIELYLVGLELAAEGVHLDDAADRTQSRGDLPLQDAAQLHERLPLAPNLELEDFAQAGGDRPHLGCAVALGYLLSRGRQALLDKLPGKVDVHVVVEHHGHYRQAEARDGADLGDVGQAAHGGLDREGDELLHLDGPEPGEVVSTWTCTLVMSGVASMGSSRSAWSPKATSTR